ncbi:MAG: glucose-1-phosphate cytidylyltransferase [Clostridiales bacterium]|nr:glucose-1-phosphate cytidylyltransferase [Clostridiales bacterium]
MKVVILAGGFGTRITEESQFKPKPMIELDGQPIMWHIMKEYSHYGFNEFVICAGYKQHVIKEYFANYYLRHADMTFDFTNGGKKECVTDHVEPWKVTVVDTGLHTMTGGRIKRIKKFIGDEPFFLTYGDGVCDIDLEKELEFHKKHGKLATICSISLDQRFGVLEMDRNGKVKSFREKDEEDSTIINGGYMILDPKVLDYIDDDSTVFEKEPLQRLIAEGQLMSFKHKGFWQCMDTQRDKIHLEELLAKGKAPWKKW